MRIEVVRDADRLNRQSWEFWFDRETIYLDSFRQMTRETPRHKFKSVGPHYQRIDKRYSTLDVDDVPLPVDVAAEAKSQVCDKITVEKWKR